MARGVWIATLFAIVSWARAVPAQEALLFEVEFVGDTRSCGDADVLRAKIAERLGRDPFAGKDGRGRLHVRFAREKRAWTGEVVLLDQTEKRLGARTLTHQGNSCDPLVASVVFTIAVLLEDLAPRPEPPPAKPDPSGPLPSAPPDPPKEAPESPGPPPTPRETWVDAALGATGAFGAAPAPIVGGEATLGLDVARARVELSGRMFFPASSDGDVGVRTRVVYGRLAPCYGLIVVAACFVGVVGSVSGEAIGERAVASRVESQLYAAGGIGALSRFFVIKELLFVRAAVDLLFAVSRAGFDVGDQRVWTVPAVSVATMIGFGARLP